MEDLNQNLKNDPRFQAAIEEMAAAMPILMLMAFEKAVTVATMLLSKSGDEREEAMVELKKTATPEQWAAFCQSTVAQGTAEVIKTLDDEEWLRQTAIKVLIALGTGFVLAAAG